MAKAGTVWVDVRGDTNQFMRDVADGARKASSGLGGLMRSGVSTVMGDIATAAGVAAVAVTGIGVAASKTAMNFDAAMSGVAAVAGATAEEMDLLRTAALEAGAETVFSASEAAEAQAELVKAGLSVSEVLGGALTGSLGLAAAGQLDLASAAEISAQAMNIFGLEGSEVSHIADVLAAGANKSAADVKQLGDALRQGGLVAQQTGLDLEDTVGVLSLFADNALIGSDAGTSLKTMLQRLVPQSDAAAEAMEDLGLKFFDAKGEFVGIEEVAGQLQSALGGLSDEQRQAALTTLFGSDAVRAASLLMEGGAEAVREYTDAVNDQGAATRMAATQLDNLKGDLEEFSGATETALINLGSLFDGFQRGWVQSGTALVNVLNDWAGTPAWAAIEDNVTRLSKNSASAFDGIAESVSKVLSGITAADVDRVFGRIEGGFRKVAKAAEGMEGVIGGLGISLASLGGAAVLGPLGGIVPTISPITGVLAGLVLGSKQGRDALQDLGKRAGEFVTGPGTDLISAMSDLSGEVSDGLVSALDAVGDAAFDAAEVLGPVLADAIRELGPPLGELIEQGGELVAEVLPLLADLAGTVLPPMIDVLGGALGLAADAAGLFAENVWLLVPALGAFAAVKFGDQISGWASTLTKTANAAKTAAQDFGTYFQVLRSEGATVGGALRGAGKEVGGLTAGLGLLNPAILGVTAAVTAGVGVYQAWATNVKRVEEESKQLTAALLEQGKDALPELARAFQNILSTRDSFDDSFAATGIAVSEVTRLVNENTGQMDEFRSKWHDAGESLNLFRESGEAIPAGVRPIIEHLFALRDAGVIGANELREVIDAMTDLDKEAQTSADQVGVWAEQIKAGLADEGIKLAGDALRDFNAAMDENSSLEARRDALSRLAAEYPKIAEAAGIAVGDLAGETDELTSATDEAADATRRLSDELEDLAGKPLDVDKAARRLLETTQDLAESFERNGKTLDVFTEAGRANRDVMDRQVDIAVSLAAAQVALDGDTAAATATLQQQADAIAQAGREAGLTEAEIEELQRVYGLTQDVIPTRVELFGAQKAEDDLNRVARDRQSTITVDANTRAARNALNRLARESGFTVGMFGAGGARASGGPVWPGVDWLVGEEGPEIVRFPKPGYVVDAKTTGQILSGQSQQLADPKAQPGGQFNDALLRRIADEIAALRTELDATTTINVASDTRDGRKVGLDIADTLWLRG